MIHTVRAVSTAQCAIHLPTNNRTERDIYNEVYFECREDVHLMRTFVQRGHSCPSYYLYRIVTST